MLGVYTGKFTFGRINYNFRTSKEKNTGVCMVYWNTGGKSADLIVVQFMKVFVAWKDSAYP
jgi:hypothetical protein